jgi:hypothetical protein
MKDIIADNNSRRNFLRKASLSGLAAISILVGVNDFWYTLDGKCMGGGRKMTLLQ